MTEAEADDHRARVRAAIGKGEFIALTAMMFAAIAFSMDAMLPALPQIGQELSPQDLNRAQLILTSFVFGMGIGTFFTGPLSDAFGRKSVMYGGAVLYVTACLVAWRSETLEIVLAARVVQGLAAASPRIVGMAIIRDMFSGREMARIMSLAMMIFTLVPAVAPLIGAGIIGVIGWRGIFLAFIAFMVILSIWIGTRLPETLPVAARRPFRLPVLWDAVRQLFATPIVRISMAVQSLCLSILFTMLSMVQPVYDVLFGRADSFASWFFFVALMSGTASILNAVLVVRVGMRRMITWSVGLQVLISGAVALFLPAMGNAPLAFALFVAYQTAVFFMAGTTMGNVNAIAMEPMGHIAGMAASVMGGVSTVVAAVIGALIGQLFDGTVVPLATGICGLSVLAFLLMLYMGHVERRSVI